jgi:hypothetical protein
MRRGLVLVLVLALGLAGCGGDSADDAARDAEEAAGSIETAVEERAETVAQEAEEAAEEAQEEAGKALGDERCEPATTDILTPISNKLTVEGGRLRNGYYVQSEDDAGIYFVSAELDGSGLQGDGDIATWATESPGGAKAIYALDDLARKHSDYRDARTAAKVSMDADGVAESRECAGG